MRIDNAQLAAFSMVIRQGTFEAAARQLNVTPSAVSQRIKQLEERLGQVLVRRATPCQPTDAGQALVRYGQEIALLESEMFSALGRPDGARGSPLRVSVAVNADSLEGWFLAVFDAVPPEPAMAFDLRVEDQDHSAALLREGAVMAAVSASALPIQGCRVEPLGIMRYLAVASPAYAARYFPAGVSAGSLQRAPMLRFNLKDGLQQQFAVHFGAEAIDPPTHYVPSVHGFADFARRGLGWGMVPECFSRSLIDVGALVEISPGDFLDTPLFWHRWRLRSPALDVLTLAVQRVAATALRPAASP